MEKETPPYLASMPLSLIVSTVALSPPNVKIGSSIVTVVLLTVVVVPFMVKLPPTTTSPVIVMFPVPDVNCNAVAPVLLPIVIVLAAAPVPTLMGWATALLPILITPPAELIPKAPAASIFNAAPLRLVVALSAEPNVKLPDPFGSIVIAVFAAVPNVNPPAPLSVNNPADVDHVDAAAAVIVAAPDEITDKSVPSPMI